MVILHSFIIGILAMLLFTYAVKKLGAAQTAAFGALTPILALIGGIILLDEIISLSKLFGICLVTAGVGYVRHRSCSLLQRASMVH